MTNIITPRELGSDYETLVQKALDDLAAFDREFDKFFGNKKSNYQMMTDKLFLTINRNVYYNQAQQIDVSTLLQFVAKEDRPLFGDVCKFVYQYIDGKPKTEIIRQRFCALLTRYLVRAGF